MTVPIIVIICELLFELHALKQITGAFYTVLILNQILYEMNRI